MHIFNVLNNEERKTLFESRIESGYHSPLFEQPQSCIDRLRTFITELGLIIPKDTLVEVHTTLKELEQDLVNHLPNVDLSEIHEVNKAIYGCQQLLQPIEFLMEKHKNGFTLPDYIALPEDTGELIQSVNLMIKGVANTIAYDDVLPTLLAFAWHEDALQKAIENEPDPFQSDKLIMSHDACHQILQALELITEAGEKGYSLPEEIYIPSETQRIAEELYNGAEIDFDDIGVISGADPTAIGSTHLVTKKETGEKYAETVASRAAQIAAIVLGDVQNIESALFMRPMNGHPAEVFVYSKPLNATLARPENADSLHTQRVKGIVHPDFPKHLMQVAGGLADMHARKMVHRSLTAHNILIDESGNAHISNLNTVISFHGLTTEQVPSSLEAYVGPTHQMAPEVYGASLVNSEVRPYEKNEKIDVWNFGALIFDILTSGEGTLYPDLGPMTTRDKPPLRRTGSDHFIKKCLFRTPSMYQALKSVLEETQTANTPDAVRMRVRLSEIHKHSSSTSLAAPKKASIKRSRSSLSMVYEMATFQGFPEGFHENQFPENIEEIDPSGFLRELMKDCLKLNPDSRPDMEDIFKLLSDNYLHETTV